VSGNAGMGLRSMGGRGDIIIKVQFLLI